MWIKSTKEKDVQTKARPFFHLPPMGTGDFWKSPVPIGGNANYQVQENYLTIFLPSELDHHNAEEIRRESDRLIERNHIRYVIFDFRDTNFMDSSGIGVIMGRYKRVYLLGGEVFAVHTSERMKRILSMSGVTKIMQICEEDM